MKKFFTSESVTEGHPDKLCDYISDSILDAFLERDENARVACETVASKNEIYVTGEITSIANIDIEPIIRNTIKEIGYDSSEYDIDYKNCSIRINISKQSPDIAQGVNQSLEDKKGMNVNSEGAGDQGIMFGYACNETEELMPLPISLAHKLAKRLAYVRKNKIIKYIRPDGKVQVTIEYENEKPIRVDTVIVSTQHLPETNIQNLKKDIMKKVIKATIPEKLLDNKTKYYINPTGKFIIGGPLGDSGLTGRKIIVDTYGGMARHGGGAFSGKDPTKVDRSASYMARFLAKNIVANGYCKKCEIQLAYSIGIARPVAIYINTYGTNTISEEKIIKKIKQKFDLTPSGIIKLFDLKKANIQTNNKLWSFSEKNTYHGKK